MCSTVWLNGQTNVRCVQLFPILILSSSLTVVLFRRLFFILVLPLFCVYDGSQARRVSVSAFAGRVRRMHSSDNAGDAGVRAHSLWDPGLF